MMVDETTLALATLGTAVAGLGALVYFKKFLQKKDEPSRKEPPQKMTKSSSQQQPSKTTPPTTIASTNQQKQPSHRSDSSTGSSKPRDVWEERRQRGITAASSHGTKGASTEQPFSSSYYYAHNNSKAAGGYKDGLTMEDFTMNGPRLLSRGGMEVDEVVEPIPDESADQHPQETQSNGASSLPNSVTKKPRRTIPISKYLWDDPGESSGKAAIRIDQLPPRRSGGSHVEWSVARSGVANIQTELRNDGMSLVVNMVENEVDYSLHIPSFYGEVTSVDHVNKAKRLIVRIQKKRGMFSSKNTQSWPHPHKKAD